MEDVERGRRSWSSALGIRRGLSSKGMSLFQQRRQVPYHVVPRDAVGPRDDGCEALLGLWVDRKPMVY